MTPENPLRPPVVLLPWAGTWINLLADAIEVGLSNQERSTPEIADALTALRARTAQRVLSGETRPEAARDAVITHLSVLLCRPEWMPTHSQQPDKALPFLRTAFTNIERLAARSTMSPNIDAAVTRAALRLVLADVALFLGTCSTPDRISSFGFIPWEPKAGIGHVVRDLTKRFQPPLKREQIIAALKISSPAVWDRLLQGEIPATVGFEFDRFAELLGDEIDMRRSLGVAMRRAFVAARFIQTLKRTITLPRPNDEFWRDLWGEFARIQDVAAKHSSSHPAQAWMDRIPACREAALAGARGIWLHTLAASSGDWMAHLETVANTAEVITSQQQRTGIPLTDDLIGKLLDRYHDFQPAQIVEHARAASGTPEALQLLRQLPRTPGNLLSLGREHMTQGDLAGARRHFEEALSIAPNDWDVVRDLAWFEAVHGDAVRSLLLLVAERFAAQREFPFVKAEALWALGRFDEALVSFQESISKEHALGHSFGRAAQCCRHLGREKESLEYAKSCRRLTGVDPLEAA